MIMLIPKGNAQISASKINLNGTSFVKEYNAMNKKGYKLFFGKVCL